MNKLIKIYYFVWETANFLSNTGIQRVVRNLGSQLMNLNRDISIQFVSWDTHQKKLCPLNNFEKDILSKFDGPKHNNSISNELDFDLNNNSNKWLFIPEILSVKNYPEFKFIVNYGRTLGFKVAHIFYDSLPATLCYYYNNEFSQQHSNYMLDLKDLNIDRIFPISNESRDNLISFLNKKSSEKNLISEKIKSILLPSEFVNEKIEVSKDFIKDSYILSVGTIEPRKNHLNLLDAFSLLKTPAKLILVGKCFDDKYQKQFLDKLQYLQTTKTLSSVEWISSCSDEKLTNLYKNAYFTIFPSVAEGFGLPIVESFNFGKFCLTHYKGSMREVVNAYGQYDFFCDVLNIEDMAHKLEILIGNSKLIEEFETKIKEAPKKSWEEYALQICHELDFSKSSQRACGEKLLTIVGHQNIIHDGIEFILKEKFNGVFSGKYLWILEEGCEVISSSLDELLRLIKEQETVISNDFVKMFYLNHSLKLIENNNIVGTSSFTENDKNQLKFLALKSLSLFTRMDACVLYRENYHQFVLSGKSFSQYLFDNMLEQTGYWLGSVSVILTEKLNNFEKAEWNLSKVFLLLNEIELQGVSDSIISRYKKEINKSLEHYLALLLNTIVPEQGIPQWYSIDLLIQNCLMDQRELVISYHNLYVEQQKRINKTKNEHRNEYLSPACLMEKYNITFNGKLGIVYFIQKWDEFSKLSFISLMENVISNIDRVELIVINELNSLDLESEIDRVARYLSRSVP
jgi:glycosyltransferase involved in cell wall biosynthesis